MKKIAAALIVICLSLSLALPALAAEKTLDLTKSWQLTSDLDPEVPSGDILIIDGGVGYNIYEMGGTLINTGEGFVKLENTILYPDGNGTKAASAAALLEFAESMSVTASKDATTLSYPSLDILTNANIVITASSRPEVIATNEKVVPPASASSVILTLTVTGNGAMVEGKTLTVSVPARSSSNNNSSNNSNNDYYDNNSDSGDNNSVSGSLSSASATGNGIKIEVGGSAGYSANIKNNIMSANISAKSISASVDKLVNELKSNPDKAQVIEIKANNLPNTVDTAEFIFPASAIANVVENTNAALSINIDELAAIILDSKALASATNSGRGDIKLVVQKINDAAALNNEQKAAVGSKPVYDLSIYTGSTKLSNFGLGKVSISLPYNPKVSENKNGIVVYYVDANCNLQIVKNSKYTPEMRSVDFTINHFSLYMIGNNYKTFADISGHWGVDAIEFVASRGLVDGVGDGKFEPYREIKRSEFVQIV